jgi:hypothetical protein
MRIGIGDDTHELHVGALWRSIPAQEHAEREAALYQFLALWWYRSVAPDYYSSTETTFRD